MYLPAKKLHYEFNHKISPVQSIAPGETLRVETYDSYQRHVKKAPLGGTDTPQGLPLSGPIMVKTCQPGDLLCVDIVDIQCQAVGVTSVYPGSGLCPDMTDIKATLLHHLDNDQIIMPAGFQAPVRPMVGCIGVAPQGKSITSITPGPHGGNLDCPDLGIGTRIYLNAEVSGALLSLGDVHGRQGYGEFCGAAVEVGADVTLRTRVIPKQGGLASWPLLETADEVAVLASAASLEEAARQAVRSMVALVSRDRGASSLDTYVALTQVADVRICQLVNPWYTVGCYLPRRYLSLGNLWE